MSRQIRIQQLSRAIEALEGDEPLLPDDSRRIHSRCDLGEMRHELRFNTLPDGRLVSVDFESRKAEGEMIVTIISATSEIKSGQIEWRMLDDK